MSTWLLPLILLLARDAEAQDAGAAEPLPTPDAEPAPDANERLELAVRAYQSGQYEEARTSLALLVNDPGVSDVALRQQARIYLGEILYVQGQEDAAFKVFESVLIEAPDFRIDPFRHPPDVCGFFEVVRASIHATDTLPPPRPTQSLKGTWTGFGAWQRTHGQPVLGNLLLTGQVVLGLTSAATFAILARDHQVIIGSADEARTEAIRIVQWTSTAGFWGLYTWGTLSARHQARQEVPPGAPSVGVGVSGSW